MLWFQIFGHLMHFSDFSPFLEISLSLSLALSRSSDLLQYVCVPSCLGFPQHFISASGAELNLKSNRTSCHTISLIRKKILDSAAWCTTLYLKTVGEYEHRETKVNWISDWCANSFGEWLVQAVAWQDQALWLNLAHMSVGLPWDGCHLFWCPWYTRHS